MVRSVMMLVLVTLFPVTVRYAQCSREEAVALVKEAVVLVDSIGVDEAIKVFNNPEGGFVRGALYVFGYDTAGTIITHPKNAKLIGRDLLDVPDVNGKYFRKEIVKVAKTRGYGWVDYNYINPQAKRMQDKSTYLQKVKGVIICCGIYK